MIEKQISEYLKEFLETNELNLKEEQLDFYHNLLEEDSKIRKKWLERILQLFDQDFFCLMRNEDFCTYFFTQRKNIDFYLKKSISKRICEINKIRNREIDEYLMQQIDSKKNQMLKKVGDGKKFGFWD